MPKYQANIQIRFASDPESPVDAIDTQLSAKWIPKRGKPRAKHLLMSKRDCESGGPVDKDSVDVLSLFLCSDQHSAGGGER